MDTGMGQGGRERRASGAAGARPDGQPAPRPRAGEAADARLALLARAVAHELNNMLMVVHGSAEGLREAAEAGQPADVEVIDDLLGACQRAVDLARRLQAFGHRHAAGGSPASIDDLLREG